MLYSLQFSFIHTGSGNKEVKPFSSQDLTLKWGNIIQIMKPKIIKPLVPSVIVTFVSSSNIFAVNGQTAIVW
jgi:hypothetical protein